jgi:hypothetical protein
MSLIGLVHLAESLFDQTPGNQDNGGEKKTQNQAAQKNDANNRDEFRHSGANTAREAGLFQVKQQSVFSTAATVLVVQNGATQNAAAPTPSAARATATPTAATITGSTATDVAQVLSSLLQSLNASLIALGLSQDEIDVVDRVAQLIKNFSPAAFTSLVNQLQVLAQDSGQANAANTTNAATNSAATATNNTAGNTQTSGGFTIEALSIKFAGINEILQQNGNSANNGKLLFSAYNLQVSEAQLTLSNPATGQKAQIQVPQGATPATTTSLATAATA